MRTETWLLFYLLTLRCILNRLMSSLPSADCLACKYRSPNSNKLSLNYYTVLQEFLTQHNVPLLMHWDAYPPQLHQMVSWCDGVMSWCIYNRGKKTHIREAVHVSYIINACCPLALLRVLSRWLAFNIKVRSCAKWFCCGWYGLIGWYRTYIYNNIYIYRERTLSRVLFASSVNWN